MQSHIPNSLPPGLPALGEASCHVGRPLKQPVERPSWGGLETTHHPPTPTCQPWERATLKPDPQPPSSLWLVLLWPSFCLEAQMVKNLPAVQEIWVRSLDQEDPLEKEMETHSSILAWRIPWTEEPGLWSMGSQRVRHN